MKKHGIVPSNVPAPVGPYSPAIRVGDLVFLAGQGPFATDGSLVGATFAEQTRQTFRNLAAVAEAAGGSLSDIVRMGAYLDDLANFEEFNQIAREFLDEPFPARTTIQADLLGFEIEIDAILHLASD
ncbi:RidA family protein [Agromyces silvae]|uniref:RidA family protein n=1 Tax=Agromyces silvae TaxID=3388266 RepID=UPI00280C0007|nr:RidA family protein [Agromyces protaetiae]